MIERSNTAWAIKIFFTETKFLIFDCFDSVWLFSPFRVDRNLKINHDSYCFSLDFKYIDSDNFSKLFRPLIHHLTTLFNSLNRMCGRNSGLPNLFAVTGLILGSKVIAGHMGICPQNQVKAKKCLCCKFEMISGNPEKKKVLVWTIFLFATKW